MDDRVQFSNSTKLNSETLYRMLLRHTAPYRHDELTVRVRYSRGADFSGACYYRDARIFINIGRANRYPYDLATHIAKARSNRTHWWRDLYRLALADAYQLTLFIYLHELYHYLVNKAGRGVRRKEAMCDRFAARVLVDDYGCRLCDSAGAPVERASWDFQDLHGFVSAAPRELVVPVRREIPVMIRGARSPLAGRDGGASGMEATAD